VSAARVVPYATGRTARRIVACALALSLLVEAVPSARAAGVDGGSNSRIGVVMAAQDVDPGARAVGGRRGGGVHLRVPRRGAVA